MDRKICFKVYDEDEEKWLKLRTAILRRYGKIRGKLGKGIIAFGLKGVEHEEGEKKEKIPAISSNKKKKILEIYEALPEIFNQEVFNRTLEKQGLLSQPTKRDYLNFFEGWSMILEHHLNPRSRSRKGKSTPPKVYEKGDLPYWLKGKS